MEKFFTVNGKKYVITREFKFGKKKETYERKHKKTHRHFGNQP